MEKTEIRNPKSRIFLGVDGGQSHTEAVIADGEGNILGRGMGGASNHAEQPGGRERLRNAILESVGEALNVKIRGSKIENHFFSAHFGMTGGADYKEKIIGEIITAEHFSVGHDAPVALCGATAGKPGIVVIAGTGAVVYGENAARETARVGGLGYLFSDEGSGFWLAAQTIRLAIKEQDGLVADEGLERLVLDFFGAEKIRDVTTAFYNEKISRDQIASLARTASDAAQAGNKTLENEIRCGAGILAESVSAAASRLRFDENFPVAGVGGMFGGELMKSFFRDALAIKSPLADVIVPRFGAAIGALFAAYRQAEIETDALMLENLKNSQNR